MRVTTSQYEIIKRQKSNLLSHKRFSPEHNLPITEKNSLEQAAFWHEVKVVCCLLTPFYTKNTCFVLIFLTHQHKLFQIML